MKIIKKDVPIYFGRLDMVISDDFKSAADQLGIDYSGHDLALYCAFTEDEGWTTDGEPKYTIFLSPDCKPDLIAHEAVHIANYIYKNAHIKHDFDNDEPFAYLVAWVVGEIHKSLKK